MAFKKFPEKMFINDIEVLGWENAVERWRVDTKEEFEKRREQIDNHCKTAFCKLILYNEVIEEFLETLK